MSAEREQLAQYIGEALAVYARESRKVGLHTLAYLLDLAWMEAQLQPVTPKERRPRRERARKKPLDSPG